MPHCRENLQRGGGSSFIAQVFDPSLGAASKPDDVLRRHTLKSLTVSESISTTGTNGDGLIVLYPNNASAKIGAVYTYDAQGQLQFNKILAGPQVLAADYDFLRVTGRCVKVSSSTIPSGAYAISGTFNATTYNGNLSDIGAVNGGFMPRIDAYGYNAILGITGDAFDQVAAVPVLEGIQALSLPPIDEAYTRLADVQASSSNIGQATSIGRIKDTSDDYTIFGESNIDTSIPVQQSGSEVTVADFGVQFDTFTTAFGHVYANYTVSPPTGQNFASSGEYNMNYEIKVSLIGLTGNAVHTDTFYQGESVAIVASPSSFLSLNYSLSQPFTFSAEDITEPVVAAQVQVKVLYTCVDSDGDLQTNTNYVTAGITGIEISGQTSGRAGANNPLNLIAYKGLTESGVITIEAKCNYEAVPNANLIKNLDTTYPSSNSGTMSLYKSILEYRRELGIKTVMTPLEYEKLKVKALAFSEAKATRESIPLPLSDGFWDIIRMIKDIAVPGLGMIFPEFAPVALAGGQIVDWMADRFDPKSSGLDYHPLSSGMVGASGERRMMNRNTLKGSVLQIPNACGALFPVVYSTPTGSVHPGLHVALVVNTIDDSSFPRDLSIFPSYKTNGPGRVYNAVGFDDVAPFSTDLQNDVILLPVEKLQNGVLVTSYDIGPCKGESHMLATKIADTFAEQDKRGVTNLAFTGGLMGDKVTPVLHGHEKRVGCNREGSVLIGNAQGVDVPYTKLSEVTNFSLSEPLTNMASVTNGTPLGDNLYNTPFSSNINLEQLLEERRRRAQESNRTANFVPNTSQAGAVYNQFVLGVDGLQSKTTRQKQELKVAVKVLMEYPDVTAAIAGLFRDKTPTKFERMILALYKEALRQPSGRTLPAYKDANARTQSTVVSFHNALRKLDPEVWEPMKNDYQKVVDYINNERGGRFFSSEEIKDLKAKRDLVEKPEMYRRQLTDYGVPASTLTDSYVAQLQKMYNNKGLSATQLKDLGTSLGIAQSQKKTKEARQQNWENQLMVTASAAKYASIPENVRMAEVNQIKKLAADETAKLEAAGAGGGAVNEVRAALGRTLADRLKQLKMTENVAAVQAQAQNFPAPPAAMMGGSSTAVQPPSGGYDFSSIL